MIHYIHFRLGEWGRAIGRGGLVRGLGYPRAAAFTRLTPSSNNDCGLDDGPWDIERCVHCLDQEERRLVSMMYVQNLKWRQIAIEMGCTEMTVSNRLHRVHVRVQDYLNDMAAGIPLPEPVVLKKIA